jgi:hypothetical protein
VSHFDHPGRALPLQLHHGRTARDSSALFGTLCIREYDFHRSARALEDSSEISRIRAWKSSLPRIVEQRHTPCQCGISCKSRANRSGFVFNRCIIEPLPAELADCVIHIWFSSRHPFIFSLPAILLLLFSFSCAPMK